MRINTSRETGTHAQYHFNLLYGHSRRASHKPQPILNLYRQISLQLEPFGGSIFIDDFTKNIHIRSIDY
jgi:hypothetical protein